MTKILNTAYLVIFSAVFFFLANSSAQAVNNSQEIILNPGWNIVSTPRIVDSHQFSTDNSNFDIYLLNPKTLSGWSTMAELGQTEFTPLYGYFIKNKTDSNQTLTLSLIHI